MMQFIYLNPIVWALVAMLVMNLAVAGLRYIHRDDAAARIVEAVRPLAAYLRLGGRIRPGEETRHV